MCHDGTGLRCNRAQARLWSLRAENRPPQRLLAPRSGSTRTEATLENRPNCAAIAVPLLEPGDAQKHAAQGRKAAPTGGPIGSKSGGSITPKSGGPIRTKSGGSNHTKSCIRHRLGQNPDQTSTPVTTPRQTPLKPHGNATISPHETRSFFPWPWSGVLSIVIRCDPRLALGYSLMHSCGQLCTVAEWLADRRSYAYPPS